LINLLFSNDSSSYFFSQLLYFLLKLIQANEYNIDISDFGLERLKTNDTKYIKKIHLIFKFKDQTFGLFVSQQTGISNFYNKIAHRLLTTQDHLQIFWKKELCQHYSFKLHQIEMKILFLILYVIIMLKAFIFLLVKSYQINDLFLNYSNILIYQKFKIKQLLIIFLITCQMIQIL
jgi:hypothetical protein